ncbi:MAG: carboxypeptidase regulatory-like domain-containing protein [Nitrosopumilaceae archaeon]|uniref:Carboxypeptidase regulatory-like domain-containing protein n=1 Tax=Candidatus Nitrosomaritimum aestuariumsis TaxID=3342354 RepID=A0AC60W2C5_9ARCH|nr:carboxypeptidase regulatory-like domain-containing protein [Nitrosopumilaceae archaeon]
MYKKIGLVGIFSFLMLISIIQTSEAELWELIIDLNVEKGAIVSGETLVVTGKVVDHAYKPIRGAEVFIRTGSETTKAFTDPWGVFRAEFENFERVPGTYTINVVATWYGMTGLDTTQVQIKGDASPVSLLQQKLNTDEAIKYLSSNESDFEKDPIGQTLFKYYHGLLQELILENKEAVKPNLDELHVEEQRSIADDLTEQAIEEYNPGYGVFDLLNYEYYVNSLDPEIQDIVSAQLNFTKNIFEEAQLVKAQIIADGGTYEEAQQAYLEMLAIPKEKLEEFNDQKLEELENSQTSEENTEESEESSEEKND